MDKKEFSQKLKDALKTIEIDINEEKSNDFFEYMNLLINWNEKVNLTSITDPEDIVIKHFLDSLTVLKYINEEDNVIDIGTGAGFPGIPLNIINNNKMTLVDSLNKRINFLNEVIKELQLSNIETIHSRVEELAKNNKYRENYSVAVSRAVAPLNVLLEYVLPYVKLDGQFICMKGSNIEEEINNSKKALSVLGGEIEKIEELELGKEKMKRSIIIIRKKKPTPKGFPRKAGTPTKDPII